MASPAECNQTRGHKGGLVDRRLVAFLKPPREPACRDAGVSPRILDGDQRGELQSLDERDAADLPQRVFRDEQVAALYRPSKGGPRMSLRGRACLSGAGGVRTIPGRPVRPERAGTGSTRRRFASRSGSACYPD